MSELNPNHPVTSTLRDQELYHKLLALVMRQFGRRDLVITSREVEDMANAPPSAIVVHVKNEEIHLRLVSMAEGERLAREHRGLPT